MDGLLTTDYSYRLCSVPWPRASVQQALLVVAATVGGVVGTRLGEVPQVLTMIVARRPSQDE
jgi:hypothetical protein